MVIDDIAEFMSQIPKREKLLALDIGSKTIGLAVSDFTYKIASASTTIRRKKFSKDLVILQQEIKSHDTGGLVVGLPLNMDGSEGKTCQSIRQFVRNLLKEFDIPVIFHDERLTTHSAEQTLIKADVSRQKRALIIDKVAAAYILQSFLDKLNHQISKNN